ncbi:hypothetical protein DYB32_006393 [Aphanomyces invadans]|uniref:Tubulin-tyrosine ligase n=1 Tax=Aphanomyces invadans TaxID=157072 RepID=A0A3R6VV33_9STRA|nr:hypothetical protein DYB32_006393 [Aphanomyces invadans]
MAPPAPTTDGKIPKTTEKPFKRSRKVVKSDVEWDIWWSDRGELLKDARRLNAFQKVNHFPSMEDICRKDFLANNLNAMRKLLPDDYDFFPRSFLIPAERMELQQCMEADKPIESASDAHALDEVGEHQPHTGLTLLVSSYAINKKSKDFVRSADETTGSKRSLAFVMQHLQDDHGMDPNAVWADICDVVLKTLLAIQPRLAASYRNFFGADEIKGRQWGPAAFEILGFDVMLDERGKAWMVEVNHAPSFAGDSTLDKQIKTPLIAQALDILAVTNLSKRQYQSKHRKVWKTRLWNATSAVAVAKKAKGDIRTPTSGLVEPPPPVVEPQVVELTEEDAVDPVDDNGSGLSEDENENDSPAKEKSSSNKIHPDDSAQDNNHGKEMDSFGNTYERIYPPPASMSPALSAKYARILAAAETNRSKLWG